MDRPARSLVRRAIAIAIAIVIVGACTATGGPDHSTAPAPTSTNSPARTPAPSPAAPTPTTPAPPDAMVLAQADVPRAAADAEEATAAARSVNAFGLDLYRVLATGEDNLVFSPTSIATALGMARAGARGDTAADLDAVLYELASDQHVNWLNSLDLALAERSGTYTDDAGTAHEVSLEVANAYFAQHGLSFEGAYLEALASRFGAGMRLVDFERDPEAARRLIVEWASDQTRGRIPEILKAGEVTASWRLALVNAIYLKAPWARPFDVEQTTTERFTRIDGSTLEVPMMHGRDGVCATGDGWQAARLAYVGNGLSMTVVVPDDLETFEGRFDGELLGAISAAFEERYAQPDLSLPRFDIEMREELKGQLQALGLVAPLDPARADFSGMTTEERLAIGTVIHQANITVDEKGTEAAAVTVIGMGDSAGGPPETCTVTANRPFVFLLQDETGAILFFGRVMDPS
jgi:serine protease inhibitor